MKLFKKLASIYSGSGGETKLSNYIISWVYGSIDKKELSVVMDKVGNIYITRGKAESYPCVVAHLDQVQDKYPNDYMVLETSEHFMGFSPSTRSYHGLGGDDKCGIWIALKMLLKHEVLKVAFFVGEEIGCIGSRQADMTFFDDCRFVIEPDRRGANDLITSIGGGDICSEAFLNAIDYEEYDYTPTSGLMTDVLTLHEQGLGLSCINLSCGYYNPHTEEEYVVKCDMENAKNFVDHIISKCVKTYPHTFVRKYYAHNEHRFYHDGEYAIYDDYDYYDRHGRIVDVDKRGYADVFYGASKNTVPQAVKSVDDEPNSYTIDDEINLLYDYLEDHPEVLREFNAVAVCSDLKLRNLNPSDVRAIMEDVILSIYSEEEADEIFRRRWDYGEN